MLTLNDNLLYHKRALFMKIVIILKMPYLILSTILDLMLLLVLVNYFGNLSWQYKQVILYSSKQVFFKA